MGKREMDKMRRILEEMKANGVTISYKPATGDGLPGLGERAMGIVHQEAQKLGMTYDDPEPTSAPWCPECGRTSGHFTHCSKTGEPDGSE